MKINSYCAVCGVPIKYYNRAKLCQICWKNNRKKHAKWLIKFCVDCKKQLKSKNPKTKRCKPCAGKIHGKVIGKIMKIKWKNKKFRKKNYQNIK